MLSKRRFYIIFVLVFVLFVLAIFLLRKMILTSDNKEVGYSSDTSNEDKKESSTSNSKDDKEDKNTGDTKIAGLSPDQKKRAEILISLFENGTTSIRYDYIENLDDGRGYTAGKVGFTSADGDLYEVVKAYTEMDSNNPLSGYLSTLKKLADQGSDSTSSLKGFKEAWKKSAQDSKFVKAQDEISDKIYYTEAMKLANKTGVELALSKAFFYDTIIQHGGGKDEDSLSAIVSRTNDAMDGTPKDDVNEKAWLAKMIEVRRADLKNPYNEDTKDVWQDSVGRCDVFKKLLDDGNFDLTGPIKIKNKDYDKIIP